MDTNKTQHTGLKSPLSSQPAVLEIHSSKATKDEVVRALKVVGGIVIRGLLTPEQTKQIEQDARPWLEQDKPWNGDFFPPETRRAYGMMGKSRCFAEAIVGNSLWVEVCDELLTSYNKNNWVGDKIEKSVSLPQLMNTIIFSIGPGARAQVLHRDDANQHQDCRAVAEHEMGRDLGIGLFVAGKKTSKQNGDSGPTITESSTNNCKGATRFIPGSHLWDYAEGPAPEDQAVYAELEVGDAFMMLSGCFHGGSANKTTNEERLVYSTFMTRGYLRQEENQYLANDMEEVKKLPAWLQERMGFGISRPFLGWVNLESPMVALHPGEEKYQKDLF